MWVDQIDQYVGAAIPRVLIANKFDLPSKEVDFEKGQLLA
jgi:hypothetical protein